MKHLLLIFLLLFGSLAHAQTWYVDNGTKEADATWNEVNGATYTCPNGTGKGSSTLQYVIWGTNGSNGAANPGDTIYLRSGTYSEDWSSATSTGAAMQIPTRLNGSAEAWTTISSYPGEWAVITDDNVSGNLFMFGYGDLSQNNGVGGYKYWSIERLEFAGGNSGGLAIKYGPVKVRYCYIHDCGAGAGGDQNKAGLHMRNGYECTIEFNYFYNNGNTATDNNSNHIENYGDYMYDDVLEEGAPRYNWDYCNRDNEIRYNYFGGGNQDQCYRDKGGQYLTTFDSLGSSGLPTDDLLRKANGNKIHHNISLGTGRFLFHGQEFAQIHHNITDGSIGDNAGDYAAHWKCIYNNTVLDNFISTSGPDNDSTNFTTMDMAFYLVNNLVSVGVSSGPDYQIALSWFGKESPKCQHTYTWTNTIVDRNLAYQPGDNYHFGLANSDSSCGWLTTTAFNTYTDGLGKSWVNYTSASDGLWASTYITDGDFVVAAGKTIANGGVGGNHPYLDDVTIPSYIGATDPSKDNAWVAGVLGLATDSNEDGIPDNLLSATAGSDPTWIEGSESTPPSTPSIRNGGFRSGGIR